MTTATDLTDDAARALLALYGDFNADFLVSVFTAGWMTEGERKCFAPLVDRIHGWEVEEK